MQNNNSNIGYTSKYDEMLKQYNLDITDEEVKAAVKKIIEEKVAENNNVEVKKFLLGSVELTTLKTTDTEEEVLAMVEKVNKFAQDYPTLPHVGAICAYPCFTKLIADSLEIDGVDITNVTGNFPSSQHSSKLRPSKRHLPSRTVPHRLILYYPLANSFRAIMKMFTTKLVN